MSYIKKLKLAARNKELNKNQKEEENLNESYEARFIKEMKNEIEEAFAKKGEEIGMNEMCNNVIDNITSGKEVSELFQLPTRIKTKKVTNKLPKISQINDDKKNNLLYSEKFIKPLNKNYRKILILPLIKHKYKFDQNIKFKQGETEKILAYEYYQNSYKQCVKLSKSQESLNSVRANYKLMWNYVNTYGDKKNKEKSNNNIKKYDNYK